jgi:hypothetical protein
MLDKRTSRSQIFKNFLQLQQHQQSSPICDVFPQQRFDFTLADPSASTTYELLKSTYLYLDATQSPICSTLLTAIQTFEEFVAHSSYNFSTAVALSIQYQLVAPSLSNAPTPATSRSSPIPPVTTHADDEIFFLIDSSASQIESHCLALERQIQLCADLHSIQANLVTCEQHNLLLASISHMCKADNLRLESLLTSCQDEIFRFRAEHDTLLLQHEAPTLSQPARPLPEIITTKLLGTDQPLKHLVALLDTWHTGAMLQRKRAPD